MYFVGTLDRRHIFVNGEWVNITDKHNHLIEAHKAFTSKEAAYRDYCFKHRWNKLIPLPKNEIIFIKVKGTNAYRII